MDIINKRKIRNSLIIVIALLLLIGCAFFKNKMVIYNTSVKSYDEKYTCTVKYKHSECIAEIKENDPHKGYGTVWDFCVSQIVMKTYGRPVKIMWGKNTYDIFFESHDGTFMYRYDNGVWRGEYYVDYDAVKKEFSIGNKDYIYFYGHNNSGDVLYDKVLVDSVPEYFLDKWKNIWTLR